MWSVPKLWRGQTVAVLASGPSMSAEVAKTVQAAGVPVIVINTTFRLAPWADVLYAADEMWWAETPDALKFAGLKVSVGKVKGVHQLRNTGKVGFDPDPSALRTGGNSGYQAVHLAAHFGAKTVVLCGFDFQGGQHWHPDHKAPLRKTLPDIYPVWAKHFETLRTELDMRGVTVFNSTPGSALRVFQEKPLQESLQT